MTIVSTPDTTAMPSRAVRKARKNDRQPRRCVDVNGEPTVQVTLKGGIIATLDSPDFDRLLGRGISHQWCCLRDGKGHSCQRRLNPPRMFQSNIPQVAGR